MFAHPPLELRSSDATAKALEVPNADIRELNSLAVQGLVSMFDEQHQLFCKRLRPTGNGYVREGLSRRYSIMALLGLRAMETAGIKTPFDMAAIFGSCSRGTEWITGVGDLGLLIWLTAEYAPDRLEDLFQRVDLETCLDRFPDAREARTMELAWFLAGLSHAVLAGREGLRDVSEVAAETYRRLQENQGESGLFGHLGRTTSPLGLLRKRIGNLADQMYPIYALSKFATAFHVEEPLSSALGCGMAICGLQGSLGQWWRLYDSRTGRVVSHYPVYAVEQHGMAPMALFALEEATGQPFQQFVYNGLSWVCKSNELGQDLRVPSQASICKCILPRWTVAKYGYAALNFIRARGKKIPLKSLTVLFEGRPYELGLLLYSFARFGLAEN